VSTNSNTRLALATGDVEVVAARFDHRRRAGLRRWPSPATAGLVDLHMTSSVLLTIGASLTAGLLAVVALAIAPTIWTLVLAGVVLVAGAGAVAAAVTRATAQEDA
jgi:hypothetical protein